VLVEDSTPENKGAFRVYLWYNSPVPIFVERFALTVCAALVVALLATDPFKFDWWQRASLALAITAFALFIAATLHKARNTGVGSTDINHGTRLAISLTPTGITGKVTPVTGAGIVLQNLSDELDRHVYIKFVSPTSILSVVADSPTRVQIIGNGPGANIWSSGNSCTVELSVPELAPHESRVTAVRLTISGPLTSPFFSGSCMGIRLAAI
jgi:hypothetical protein